MQKIFIVLMFTFSLYATEVKNSFNNVNNSVIHIVKEALGKDAREDIVKNIVYQIEKHYGTMDKKLDKLLENQAFVDTLMRQVNEASKKNISLSELLKKSKKEREEALKELNELKEKLAKNRDIDFQKVLEEAEKALDNYDSKKYREILKSYREDKKNREIVKNIATTHYLSAKSYASDFMFTKAEEEIETAVALEKNNGNYLGWYGLILFNQAKYTKALEYLEKS